MSSSDKHNQITREFILKVAGETKTQPEMMVVIESMIFGAMLILHKRDGLPKSGTVEMVEMAISQATERFSQ